MECERVQLELQAYLQGELSPEERAAVEAHLSNCPACTEEATAMKQLGQVLRSGLKEWVEDGVCPPEVMQRIQQSIGLRRRRPWWRRWPTLAGAAAVAAVIMIALASVRVDLSGQIASLPLVGTLAAHLLYGDDERGPSMQPVRLENTTYQQNGLTVTLKQASFGEITRIEYTVRGANLDGRGPEVHLVGPQGEIPFKKMTVNNQGQTLEVTAEFANVPRGTQLMLEIGPVHIPIQS